MNEATSSIASGEQTERALSDLRDQQPLPDLVDYAREYARQKPEVVAMWCFGVGFVLGWKLKPW